MKSNVLVLGGGMSGIVVSNELKSMLGDEVHVSLVDRRSSSQFPPSFVWVMLGERQPKDVVKELSLLQRKGIDVVNAEVTAIDTKNERVTVSNKTTPIEYDHLVIALGAEYDPELVTGFREFANHNYDLESSTKLQSALSEFKGGSVAVGISSLPYKCPVAPYEAVLLLNERLGGRKQDNNAQTKFVFFTPEAHPLPAAGPDAGTKAEELLKLKGIELRTKVRLKEVTEHDLIFESGERIEYDLLYCVPPHRAPRVVRDARLVDSTGWIPSDPRSMKTSTPRVYAVGDVASFPTPRAFVPYLPKAGTFAVGQARIVASNIANEIRGSGMEKSYDGHGACFMEVGSGLSAMVEGDFLGDSIKSKIEFKRPSGELHNEKIELEKRWKTRWF